MELHLTDAVQIRITIQHLVQSGLVDDDKAAAVKEQLALEKAANEGDGNALYEMGRQFQAKVLRDNADDVIYLHEQLQDGQNHWWVKGARLHNPKCMAAYGQFLYWGPVNRSKGCAVDEELGQFYLYQAAANVDLAAYTIGFAVLSRDILIDQRSHKENMRYYDFPIEERIKWFSKTNLDEAKY